MERERGGGGGEKRVRGGGERESGVGWVGAERGIVRRCTSACMYTCERTHTHPQTGRHTSLRFLMETNRQARRAVAMHPTQGQFL